MIKSTELRLGNLVHRVTKYNSHYGPDVETVDKITTDTYYGELPSSTCEPIHLTEDWLKRFGFQEEGKDKYAIYYHGVILFGYWIIDGAVNVGHFIPQDIKHVHQLQNLFFSLCGKELELKY